MKLFKNFKKEKIIKINYTKNIFKIQNYSIQAKAIRYNEWGDPKRVLKLETVSLNDNLNANDVLIKMKAAPINPSDVNIVQGSYGSKIKPPATAGNEGVGIVEKVGSGVTNLKQNDRVIVTQEGLGTWSSHLITSSNNLFKVSEKIPLEYAACLSINPCTAYRLLSDFENLKEGDTIIQNASNSMVGLCVMQIAASRGIKTINVIRDRPDHEDMVEKMKAWGGYIVVTESYLRTPKFRQLISDLPKPKLALNGAGGYSATEISRHLATGGSLVTYGSMSNKPLQLPNSLLLFNDIKARGFWLKRWNQTSSPQEKENMLQQLQSLIENQKLRLWIEYHDLSSFSFALDRYYEPFKNRKVVFHCDK